MMPARGLLVALGAALLATTAGARVGVEEAPSTGPARLDAPEGAPASGTSASGATAGFDVEQGGFFVRSADGDYRLSVGGRLQARFDGVLWDGARNLDDSLSFSLNQARLYFLGNFFGQDTGFYVQLAADGSDNYDDHARETSRDLKLLDGWVKHRFSDAIALKGGQFKVPWSRQWLTSSGKLQFPDRALASRRLSINPRDVGFEGSGGFHDNAVQYALAVVNGEGPNVMNADDQVAVYGRLSVNPSGDYGYGEGDVEDTVGWATTLGVAGHYQKGGQVFGDAEIKRMDVEGGVKRAGASLQAEYYLESLNPAGTPSTTTHSYYVQGGWFLSPRRFELAARASRVLFDGDSNDLSEYSGGFNFYQRGHRLKWQAAYSYYDDQAAHAQDHRLVGQVQLWF